MLLFMKLALNLLHKIGQSIKLSTHYSKMGHHYETPITCRIGSHGIDRLW